MERIREYCLNCTNKPCKNNGCPLNNDIPEFIHEKDLKKAFEILSKTTVMLTKIKSSHYYETVTMSRINSNY